MDNFSRISVQMFCLAKFTSKRRHAAVAAPIRWQLSILLWSMWSGALSNSPCSSNSSAKLCAVCNVSKCLATWVIDHRMQSNHPILDPRLEPSISDCLSSASSSKGLACTARQPHSTTEGQRLMQSCRLKLPYNCCKLHPSDFLFLGVPRPSDPFRKECSPSWRYWPTSIAHTHTHTRVARTLYKSCGSNHVWEKKPTARM